MGLLEHSASMHTELNSAKSHVIGSIGNSYIYTSNQNNIHISSNQYNYQIYTSKTIHGMRIEMLPVRLPTMLSYLHSLHALENTTMFHFLLVGVFY